MRQIGGQGAAADRHEPHRPLAGYRRLPIRTGCPRRAPPVAPRSSPHGRLGAVTDNALTRALPAAVVAVALVGALDAAIGRTWDLVVLFVLLVTIGSTLLVQGLGQRSSVRLRPDLARSLTDRARLGGESVDQVADRAVATYLDALGEPVGAGSDAAARAPKA